MNKERFVYVTYIGTTPEAVWNALTKGELTREYWRGENISDWTPGSRWDHVAVDGKRTVKVSGQVLECQPPRRLVMTWANPSELGDPSANSKVAFDIETVGSMVRLTVTHDELTPDMERRITHGWPRVLSSLKSFLETGRPLDVYA
jgi:uncharacterized protein YndB with AHSA1/START domain